MIPWNRRNLKSEPIHRSLYLSLYNNFIVQMKFDNGSVYKVNDAM